MLYAPGQLSLPALGVTAILTQGTWGIGKVGNPKGGEQDLLVRTGGASEFKGLPANGDRCTDEMNLAIRVKNPTNPAAPIRVIKSPSYVSSQWEPIGAEMDMPYHGQGALLITACPPLSQTSGFVVVMGYGLEHISQPDAGLIAKAPDEIAVAVMTKH